MDIRKYMQVKTAPKRKVIEDDDDDVIPESPEVQTKIKTKKPKKDLKLKTKPTLKEIKTPDLFGNGMIKRTEPIVKKQKNTETGIHSDEEFDKSLLELDNFDDLDSITKQNGKDEPSTSKKSPVKNEITNKQASETIHKSNKLSPNNQTSETMDKVNKVPSNKKAVENIKKEIRDTNKRKFEEFLEPNFKEDSNKKSKLDDDKMTVKTNFNDTADDSMMECDDEPGSKKKMNKSHNKSLNGSVLTDEERHERKMYSAQLYQKYLNRSGPKHLGAKEIPEGAPNCLKDCAFLLTGVLDSFERDEVVEAIKKYGGTIKSGISKKVTHVLAGDDAGPAKTAKAQELGIPILNEDDFLKMIKDSTKAKDKENDKKSSSDNRERDRKPSSDKKERDRKPSSDKKERDRKPSSDKEERDRKPSNDKKERDRKSSSDKKDHDRKSSNDAKERDRKPSGDKKDRKHSDNKNVKDNEMNGIKKEKIDNKEKSKDKLEIKKNHARNKVEINPNHEKSKIEDKIMETGKEIKIENKPVEVNKTVSNISNTMWVEKHKPQNLKQIIGQHGEASNVNKLVKWLTKWYVNRKAKIPKPSPWAKNDDGAYYKAALLSGPPGVGKTTTVSLVCKELGFDMVEFNASDTRNKTLIREQIGELLTTTSLSAYAKGDTGKQAVTKKHVLVMDEVDGMAGNEDRGGLQELIGLIKTTSVPIICMCNDRNSQKMRSLVNYCYDLRFSRPRVDQIKAAMRSVCCKENIKIPPEVLGQLIISANQDVRQTLNLLSMWAIDPDRMDTERLTKDAATTKKDVKLGPWEAIRKVFSAEDHKTMSINDKSDLFFYDYSLAPLFVQENYLQVQPHCPKNEILERVSNAADGIAFGDVIDARIRGSQAWSLLPMQAMYSSVLPGHYMSGHMGGQIQFPGWLGKNSRANKMHRLCQEIHAHARLSTTGSKSSIFLDYAPALRDAIVNPLIKEKTDGIDKSLDVLESYHLLREDLESLTELSIWPGQRNPTVLIDPKVKAAMTRAYNKKATALPYAPGVVKKTRVQDDGMEEIDTEDVEEEGDSDPENDALIKKKKDKPVKSIPSDKNDKPSTSKGKSSSGKSKKK